MKLASKLILAAFLPALSFADTISIQSPATNPTVGDTFIVDVNVADITDLYAFQFDLSFDPTLLSAVSVAEGAFLPSSGTTFFIPGTIDNVGGTITANADTLIGAIPGVTGDGTLVEVELTALAPGTSALSFGNEILLDSSLNDITAETTFQNGSVTIGGVSAVPEPSTFSMVGTCFLIVLPLIALRRRCPTSAF
jgi:general secretion pathway protein D